MGVTERGVGGRPVAVADEQPRLHLVPARAETCPCHRCDMSRRIRFLEAIIRFYEDRLAEFRVELARLRPA